MARVEFFTPVVYPTNYPQTNLHLQRVDSYFALGGKKAVVIAAEVLPKDKRELTVVTEQHKPVWWQKALIIASFFTIIAPLAMLIAKAIMRSQFKVVEHQSSRRNSESSESTKSRRDSESSESTASRRNSDAGKSVHAHESDHEDDANAHDKTTSPTPSDVHAVAAQVLTSSTLQAAISGIALPGVVHDDNDDHTDVDTHAHSATSQVSDDDDALFIAGQAAAEAALADRLTAAASQYHVTDDPVDAASQAASADHVTGLPADADVADAASQAASADHVTDNPADAADAALADGAPQDIAGEVPETNHVHV